MYLNIDTPSPPLQPPWQQHSGEDCTSNPVYWDGGRTSELVLRGLSCSMGLRSSISCPNCTEFVYLNIDTPHPQPPWQQHSGEDCASNPVYWDGGRTSELVLRGLSCSMGL